MSDNAVICVDEWIFKAIDNISVIGNPVPFSFYMKETYFGRELSKQSLDSAHNTPNLYELRIGIREYNIRIKWMWRWMDIIKENNDNIYYIPFCLICQYLSRRKYSLESVMVTGSFCAKI